MTLRTGKKEREGSGGREAAEEILLRNDVSLFFKTCPITQDETPFERGSHTHQEKTMMSVSSGARPRSPKPAQLQVLILVSHFVVHPPLPGVPRPPSLCLGGCHRASCVGGGGRGRRCWRKETGPHPHSRGFSFTPAANTIMQINSPPTPPHPRSVLHIHYSVWS